MGICVNKPDKLSYFPGMGKAGRRRNKSLQPCNQQGKVIVLQLINDRQQFRYCIN